VTWSAWADHEANQLRGADRWRAPRDVDGQLTVFASNDYLGLTQHPAVIAAAHEALDRDGAGSGSARLIVGSRPIHGELEHELATWKGAERAALFPTGFATNLGVCTTFGGPGVLICSEELNHASIVDGARLARGDVAVYRHNDLDHLAALLRDRGSRRALVVTDTVFSMDGDIVDLPALVELCAREGALLAIDEAHAVLGPNIELPDDADVVRIGTLSKTLGALGGFVAGPARYVNLVENLARPYIFTTAPTPADTAAALAALRVLRSAEGDALVARLRAHVDRVRAGHPSPIIAFVCGEERAAIEASNQLRARGVLVPAIRPPTVAPGTSRLRVTLSAAHTEADVNLLLDALGHVFGSVPQQ
jgi:8-amino-7-oxononanoate synthase